MELSPLPVACGATCDQTWVRCLRHSACNRHCNATCNLGEGHPGLCDCRQHKTLRLSQPPVPPRNAVISVRGCSQVYEAVLYWGICQFQGSFHAGLKAIQLRNYILPARLVNTAMKKMVESVDVFVLIKETWSDPFKTVKWLSEHLQLSSHCMDIVVALQRLSRQHCFSPLYRLRPSAFNDRCAMFTSFYKSGLKPIPRDLVEVIHKEWLQERYRLIRSGHIWKEAWKVLILHGRGRNLFRYYAWSCGRRSASEPLRSDRKDICMWQGRSRSASRRRV